MGENEQNHLIHGATQPLAHRSGEISRLLKLEERREAAVAEIAIWITIGIVEGRLVPGQDLNSVELASRFNTSRTPVREALMLLESEGLVEIRARKRPRVAPFTVEQVRQIYVVRRQLLAFLGELVAERATAEDLADLHDRLEQMGRAVDAGAVDDYFWGHVDMQTRLLQIAGNEILSGILDSLELRTLVLRHSALAGEGHLSRSHHYQQRILEAFEARDGALVAMLYARATDAALSDLLITLGAAADPQPAA
jgi:DNA-binding GntR family transcriptional regulator